MGGFNGGFNGNNGGFNGNNGGFNGGFGSGSIANCRHGQNCNVGNNIGLPTGQYNNGQFNPYNTGSVGFLVYCRVGRLPRTRIVSSLEGNRHVVTLCDLYDGNIQLNRNVVIMCDSCEKIYNRIVK